MVLEFFGNIKEQYYDWLISDASILRSSPNIVVVNLVLRALPTRAIDVSSVCQNAEALRS